MPVVIPLQVGPVAADPVAFMTPYRSRFESFSESELNLRRDPLYCSNADLRMSFENLSSIDRCHLCNPASALSCFVSGSLF